MCCLTGLLNPNELTEDLLKSFRISVAFEWLFGLCMDIATSSIKVIIYTQSKS